ncbi:MAG: Na/Pi cotransporter family protein [Christensenellaceae bacterium]|jgi:phosphate:Na+ symporter|nr:Na/Pi cotransporter family protein [Christensenellaceae bacterium]
MSEITKCVFALIGGIAIFMFGMKLLSEGLEHGTGNGMRKLLSKISDNRLSGLSVGTAITAIVQSSSATTVMTVGFVNAGIMTLYQATSIIIGANIGTTVTGLLVAFSSFNISVYFTILAFIGVFFIMFAKNDKSRTAGNIMSGFGLLFVGLEMMGDAFNNTDMRESMAKVFLAIDFPLLLVLLSIVFTGIIQSSSAVSGIIIAMVGSNAISLDNAIFIMIGANIGTCVTALLASIGAKTSAKRAAVIHLLFNVIGSIVFLTIVWIFSKSIISILETIMPTPQFQVAIFHTIFNVITAAIALPFVNQLVKLSTILIPEKTTQADASLKVQFIDDRLLQTPSIAIEQVDNEIKRMADSAKDNFKRGVASVLSCDLSNRSIIKSTEEEVNFLNRAIAKFLIKISSVAVSIEDELHIGSLHHVINDIERIGDHAENFVEHAEEMLASNISFTNAAKDEIGNMYNRLLVMYEQALLALNTKDTRLLQDISDIENEIDVMKRQFCANHITRLNAGECSVDSGPYFYAVISALERIGDHLTNIGFSIKSPSGSQREAQSLMHKSLY